jgi:gamma-glutamyl hercynylcysteine S-oxide synthase
MDAAALHTALQDSRSTTLALLAAFEAALPDLVVPFADELNPPRWELGHIAWFQDHWLKRHHHWRLGTAADATSAREAAPAAQHDLLFDSSRVPHASRWGLQLPPVHALRDWLEASLAHNLGLLQQSPATDTGLYFHRLVLAHEDMHAEAAHYMAQALGIAVPGPRPPLFTGPRDALHHPASRITLGHALVEMLGSSDTGFMFDNELGQHHVKLPAFDIDSRVVCWHEYLPFIESGAPMPRYLRRHNGRWQQQRAGKWLTLEPAEPVCHVSAFEAAAWCRWAGRRLPSEAQWQHAASMPNSPFKWGAVWEWTRSSFKPYPGFVPHPYRDYSAPWFNNHRVLRGASYATHPRMHHLRYRNFFLPQRTDVFAGFRSCSL